jgi:hypothetical protein
MCVFCTGSFARFAARFHAQRAEPSPVGEKSEPRQRIDRGAAAGGSRLSGAERRSTNDPSVNSRDLFIDE